MYINHFISRLSITLNTNPKFSHFKPFSPLLRSTTWPIPPRRLGDSGVGRASGYEQPRCRQAPGPLSQPPGIYIIQSNPRSFQRVDAEIKSANTSGSLTLGAEKIATNKTAPGAPHCLAPQMAIPGAAGVILAPQPPRPAPAGRSPSLPAGELPRSQKP